MNRWNYPVDIPPARRVGSGVRRTIRTPPLRVIPPQRAMEKSLLVLGGAGALVLVYILGAIWRTIIER